MKVCSQEAKRAYPGVAMPYSAKAVANQFLELAKHDGIQIDPMKLQKLVYLAHGWYYAIFNHPLIYDPIEAWDFGPVIPGLYQEFREFGDKPITRKAQDLRRVSEFGPGSIVAEIPEISDSADESRESKAVIERVWQLYGKLSALQLSEISHAPGTPWDSVFQKHSGKLPRGAFIPPEEIKDFFTQE